jgi:hypothetical protein
MRRWLVLGFKRPKLSPVRAAVLFICYVTLLLLGSRNTVDVAFSFFMLLVCTSRLYINVGIHITTFISRTGPVNKLDNYQANTINRYA